MNCKTCDYPLWNLRERRCPECGAPFKPSDFEFVLNSVQFRCPHCAQAYYGTGPKGHLVPRRFDCVTCHATVHMDDMVLLPTEGVDEGRTRVARAPWLERDRRGFIRAFFATIGMSMVRPTDLIRGVPPESSVASAVWFGVLANLFYSFVGALPFIAMMLLFVGARARAGPGVGGAPFLGAVLFVLIGGPVAFLIVAALWTLAAHAILLVSGGAPGGIRRTAHAMAYASGANALTAIPCLGIYFSWIVWVWWAVSATLMVQRAHRVHGGRAALAVVLPPALIAILLASIVTTSLFLGAQAATAAAAAARTSAAAASTASPELNTQRVLDGLLAYAASHDGQGPPHALTLIGDQLTPSDITLPAVGGGNRVVPFAGFRTLAIGSDDERAAIARAAADTLPDNVIAHRAGDFVFTYHRTNLHAADPLLWVVIFSPDPDQPSPFVSPAPLVVGRADGLVTTPGPNPVQAVINQNELRALYNLPSLPTPAVVTHDNPAVADDQRP